jgi:hypothetical protein
VKQRVLIVLAALGVLCALAFWLLSRHERTSTQGVALPVVRSADESEVRNDSLTETSSDPAIQRAAADTAIASAPDAPSGVDQIHAGMALVAVLVIDKSTRAPVAGARVYLMCDSKQFGDKGLQEKDVPRGVPFEILITDARGHAEIETPADLKSDLVARGDDASMGFATREIEPLPEGVRFEVTVEIGTAADMPFWVKVLDEATQAPLAGVKIVPRFDSETAPRFETDAVGLAKVQAKSWEPATFSLASKGRAELFVVTESGHERADNALVVTLPLAATLRVHAVLASGAPAAGADVHLSAQSYEFLVKQQSNAWPLGADPTYWMNFDDDGRATFADLPPRVHLAVDVRGKCRWKAPEPIVLEPGEVRDVEWSITEGCEIRGTLVDQNGRPVALQAMWLSKPQPLLGTMFQAGRNDSPLNCVTNSAGQFTIARVSPGSWWLGPAPRDVTAEERADEVAPLAKHVEIAPDQTTLEVTLRVDRGLFIRGHVLDSSGRPAGSVQVFAFDRSQRLLRSCQSKGDDGAFSIGPLVNGNYDVKASGSHGDADSPGVAARPGQDDVVLRLGKGASISGRVLGDDGNGVAGILRIGKHGSTSWGIEELTVANDGSFQLDGLAPGSFDLSARTTNGWIGYVGPIEVAPGGAAKDLIVHVSAGGKVRVREDGPEKMVSVSILQRGTEVAGDYPVMGVARELAVPLGSVVVRVRYYDDEGETILRTAERTVEVRAGDTVDIVFEKDAD